MFASLLKNLLGTSLPFFTLFSISAIAGQSSMGGVIHFTGRVVESPCEVTQHQEQLEISCLRDGQMQTRRFNPYQVVAAPRHFQQFASVNLTYLNEEKSLAIMNIEYR